MSELLAPAGSFEAFKAAVANGADAVYLGLSSFSARAYAANFTLDDLEKVINIAHLRNIKIYVAMNTIVYENELPEAERLLGNLYLLGVDGIIVQDLALLTYITSRFPNMEAHASTQMGIEDLDGVKLMEKLGAKRVVLARETSISSLQNIKKNSSMPIEIFVYGALCVSYSGNCLMSGLIGMRSGNRGRCVGSCRNTYQLINKTTDEKFGFCYPLSMKDLNTINHIEELKIADSLKIEGRMKEPYYVANVVRSFRAALDNEHVNFQDNLKRTFNRTFTDGYLFNKKIDANIERPNNFGFLVGKVVKQKGSKIYVSLTTPLYHADTIRIASSTDVTISINKLYLNDQPVTSLDKEGYIISFEKVSPGDLIYKTRDSNFIVEMRNTYNDFYKKYPVSIWLEGKINQPLTLTISMDNIAVTETSKWFIEEAKKTATTKEMIAEHVSKMSDNPYFIDHLEINTPDNIFISISNLNELRRLAMEKFNATRLKKDFVNKPFIDAPAYCYPTSNPQLAVYCQTKEQYAAAVAMNVDIIYYQNVVQRNNCEYQEFDGEILVGGYGGINHYCKKDFVTDFSLNVVNSRSVNLLHHLGAKRVTLSHEINRHQIKELLAGYYKNYGGYPNLEMIVYGRQDMLYTKFCPLRAFKQCGKCHENKYVIQDQVSYFPIINHNDCSSTILNGKILNLIDDIINIDNINVYRIQLTIEDNIESKLIIESFQNCLQGKDFQRHFDPKTDTRGHLNRDII